MTANPTGSSMRIVQLQSENVKRLRAVSITPDGAVVVIKGQNEQGKSSVLDSIAYALGGEKLMPPEVIRRGEKSAQVTLDLGEFIVTRRWTPGGSTLEVKSREGARYASPQKVLDGLVGSLSFDPLAFAQAKPKEQTEILRRLAGLDFTRAEVERAEVFSQRTIVNREVALIEGAVARMPLVEAPDEPVSVAELLAEQQRRADQQHKLEELQRAEEAAQREVKAAQAAVAQGAASIAELERRLSDARAKQIELEATAKEKERAAARAGSQVFMAAVPDLAGIREQLAGAEGVNARVRAKKARAAEVAKLKERSAASAALTARIAALDQQKADQIAAAKFPVSGLSVADVGVTLDGLPLEQASQAARLRVSLAVGIALNPKLKVLLIRDASLLDERSLALVAQMAADADAQVWLEVVGSGGPPGVVIEDGAVA